VGGFGGKASLGPFVEPVTCFATWFFGENQMKLMLMACIFFAGVYLGLNTDPDGELARVVEQVQTLIHGEPEW
jgi:hypothetical protein